MIVLVTVRNIVVQCGTNNISTDSPRDIADCIVDVGIIFWRKSNTLNIIICGLIPRDECWSVNRLLINKVNDILKYECHKNGFVFIVQDHEWTLPNGSFDCSLFYKDSLNLVEQGNFKLAKSVVSTLTSQNNQINFPLKNRNTLYSDVSKQSVPATISFSSKEDDFPPFTNVCRPVSKSRNCSNDNTTRSIAVLSNVSGHVKRLYQCKPVKAVCFSNVSKQNDCNVSSVSKLVKPLTVSKPVCSTIVSKSNICNASIVRQHVKPLNVSKFMNSCNVRNRIEPLSVSKSDCSRNVSKPIICKSLDVKPLKVSKSMSFCNVRNRNVHIVQNVHIVIIPNH